MKNLVSKRGIVFLTLFVALTLIGMEINFSPIIGADNQFFTLFQFFGPIAGAFLGIFGVAAVLFAELINFVLVGKEVTIINLLRLTPMLFAAYYFSRNKETGFNDKIGTTIPVLAMIAFWSTPAGAQAWYYALFWLIPVIVKFLPDRLLFRSLGSTFTAHAVGSSLWALTIPMTAAQWTMLIPIVAFERGLFALGICASFVIFTNILNTADKVMNWDINKFVNIDRRYVYA